MEFRGPGILMIAAAAILLGGCAEGRYIYKPAQQATATVGNLPAARYAIPAEKPTGEVLVASSGLTELPASEPRAAALFVRLVVTNNTDDTPWSLDTRQQFAFIAGQKQSPAYANTYSQPQPVLEIPKGEKRLVDLYYRLPPRVDGDEQVPQFDFAWNVQTAARPIAERTSFDRMRVEPVYAGGYYPPYYGGYGYGYPYWHDPFYRGYPYGVGIGVGHYYGGWGGYGYRGFGGYGGYGGYPGGSFGGGSFGGGRPSYNRAAPIVR